MSQQYEKKYLGYDKGCGKKFISRVFFLVALKGSGAHSLTVLSRAGSEIVVACSSLIAFGSTPPSPFPHARKSRILTPQTRAHPGLLPICQYLCKRATKAFTPASKSLRFSPRLPNIN
ncbi:hypothetical protein [Herbaspirillum rubrisubalbicans]|uniref:hypothetical protein n=1 Tax=Herbaspirillum rubrisubalbicans TaxID=80842 RepID=UPI0011D2BD04|nr:hypothetical protein [Herbaspirillum rubrisubalbicans]